MGGFIAADPVSVRLLEEIRRIAASGSTVLLRGESGAGKDMIASLMHYLGPRPEEPLLKLDCVALPRELLESELFGYERGAFAGAPRMKRGRLELAGAGTLVVDEVAALSMPAQAKLLRAIEEKRFERVGGADSVAAPARIIALTGVDLEHAVARRTFREDLYYRLNVIPVFVPPLRGRAGDVRPMAEAFLTQLTQMHRKPHLRFSSAALDRLASYDFPGNVQELRGLVERAVVYGKGPEITPEDLPVQVRQASANPRPAPMSLEALEREHIGEVLAHTRGKKTQAARILGISRKTLLEKRKRYGLA